MGLKYVGFKMKNVREIVLGVAIIVLMFMQNVNAATITWTGSTTGTQAWSTITNWSGSAVPAVGSDLVINLSNGDALIITAMPARAFNSLTINVASGTASIVFQGTGTAMTLGGNAGTDFTIGAGVSCTFAGTGNIANLTMAASATADIAGNLTIAAGSTMACSSSSFSFSGSGTQLTVAGTFTPATSTMNFSASGDQNIPALTYYKLTTSGSGTKTALGAITILTAGTLTYNSGTTLDMGVNALSVGATFTSAGTGTLKTSKLATPITTGKTWTGTVEYAVLTGGQTVMAGTYNNLTLSNTSGSNTTSANTVTVSGTFTTTTGGTFAPGFAVTLNGDVICGCTMAATALVTYGRTTGSQNVLAGSYAGLTSSNTSGTNTACGAISMTGTLNTSAGGVFDMSTYALSGALTPGNLGILKTSNTSATPITTGKTWTGTVEYAASGDQTIVAGTYNNLTVSGSGNKSLAGAVTLGATGVLTFNGGVVVPGLNILMLNNTATGAVANASSTSYIDGALKRKLIASTSYLFPVGTSTTYYPFTFVTPGTITAGTYMSLSASVGPTGGTLGTCVNSISSEYWTAVVSVNNIITGGVVSLGRSTGIGSYNCIARSATASAAGSYSSFRGTVSGDNINTSNDVGAIATTGNAYFAMAVSGTTPPTITTPTSASVNTSSALLGGNITNTGCTNVSERGIYYSTTNGFADGEGTKVSETPGPYNTGAFTVSVTGLMFGTTYYYKAFATNSGGTVYTTQGTFTTTTSTFPVTDSYEGSGNAFPATTLGSYSPSGWVVNTASGDPTCGSGAYYAKLALNNTNQWLFTPVFTATAGKIYTLAFSGKNTANATSKAIYLCTAQNSGSADLATNYYVGSGNGSTWSTETASSWLCTSSGSYCFGFLVSTGTTTICQIDCINISETDPATITWDGSTDGTWATAANWDLNRAPSSSDIIVIPSGLSNYPSTIPSGAYNEIRLTNGSTGTITVGSGTPITLAGSLSIASSGQPVTVANTVSIGGNLVIGTTGNSATFSLDSNATVNGYFSLGNASLANTYNFQGRVNANGNFTMGTSSTQTTNITYTNDSVCVFSAPNITGSTVFYGAMNYNSTNPQLIMKGQYLGVLGLNNAGTRYMNGDLNLDENFNLTGGKMYASDIKGLIIGDGSGTDMNTSPFRGSNKSERWQTIIQASDLDTDLDAGDFFKALSFKVQTKASSGSFNNFVIKAGLTDTTKFYQDGSLNFHFKETPLSVVYSRSSVNTVTGWNHFDFDQFLEWDGTKNILVEITWYSTTAPGGDDICFIGPNAGSGADIQLRITDGSGDCRTTSIGQNSNYKPQIKVNYLRTSFNINAAKDWNNTGTTFYHTNNTVTFDGSVSSQVIRTNESHFNNAIFQNSSGYIISTDTCTIENTMTMTAGNFTTGANVIELGTSVSNLGTLVRTNGTVIGYFKRWFAAATVSNVLFPLGTASYYRPGLLSFSSAPAAGGSVTGVHIAADAGVYNGHLSDTPLVESSDSLNSIMTDGYWNFSPNTLSGGQYDVELTATGYAGITDYTKLHMLKRPDANSEWALVGNHITTAGSNAAPVLQRTGVTGFSDFVPSKPTSTLPISLLSFTATCNQGVVDVRWITSSEVNNNYYTVERSSNLLQWETIAQVNGAGNSNSTRNYMVTDGASNSLVYYRLKQTDYNSKFEYFAPVAVQSCESDESFVKVVVNPIKDKLELLVSGVEDQQIEVSINNGIGEMLFQEHFMVVNGENRLFIDLSMLSPGIYFCNVKLNNGKTHVLKVVITR